MAGTITARPTSYGSAAVAGQLVGFQTSSAYAPVNYGSGIQAVPAVAPVNIPPSASYPSVSQGAAPGATGNGTTERGNGTSALNLRESPTLWAVLFLLLGFVVLRHVHWRRG